MEPCCNNHLKSLIIFYFLIMNFKLLVSFKIITEKFKIRFRYIFILVFHFVIITSVIISVCFFN